MGKTLGVLLVSLIWGFFGTMALGAEWPALDSANARLYPIEDQRAFAAAVIQAIDSAGPGEEVTVITYILSPNTHTGLPVIAALRRAADRDVPTRVLVSAVPNLWLDPSNVMRQLLADATLKRPPEVIEFGGVRNFKNGLNFSDFIHQKIVIIGKRVAFISGFNLDGKPNFLDMGFAIQALDPDRPSLVDQVAEAAEESWETSARLQAPALPKIPKKEAIEKLVSSSEMILTPDEQRQLDVFERFLASQEPVPGELRPSRARVVTNDFIQLALTRIFPATLHQRAHMPDPIIDALVETIDSAKEIDLVAMSLFMTPALYDAVKRAIARGAHVRIFTNSRHSAEFMVPFGLSYHESIDPIVDLMTASKAGNLEVHVMNPDEQYNYLHMKLLRTESTVVFGSSNFNVNSTANNQEIMVFNEDSAVSAAMKDKINNRLVPRFRLLSCETALLDRTTEDRYWRRFLNAIMRFFY